MTANDLELARTTFTLATKDLNAAILLSLDDDQHQNYGLHLQQAFEKLIKTLIYVQGETFDHRKGHVMGYLRGRLEDTGYALDSKFETLDALEIYAVDGRYHLLSTTEREDLSAHRPLVESLLKEVASELKKAKTKFTDR